MGRSLSSLTSQPRRYANMMIRASTQGYSASLVQLSLHFSQRGRRNEGRENAWKWEKENRKEIWEVRERKMLALFMTREDFHRYNTAAAAAAAVLYTYICEWFRLDACIPLMFNKTLQENLHLYAAYIALLRKETLIVWSFYLLCVWLFFLWEKWLTHKRLHALQRNYHILVQFVVKREKKRLFFKFFYDAFL